MHMAPLQIMLVVLLKWLALDQNVRKITDKLDALGNTTAAMGKGFAIGSALLTALAMFSAYSQQADLSDLNILDPYILVGMFIGATLPFLISALTMRSVSSMLHLKW